MSANPMTELFSDLLAERAVDKIKQRAKRQVMLEDELATFRPDFLAATELLDALKCGLEARLESDNYDLPLEVRDAFDDLKKAMDKATPYEPDAYDPQDQYAGPEEDDRE